MNNQIDSTPAPVGDLLGEVAEKKPAQNLTPLMAQYQSLKEQYPDCLLFFRLGDFYEMFFDDAITASQLLGLTLTRRGKVGDRDIPMCGVPHHAVDNYMTKLIAMGKKIALAEQQNNNNDNKNLMARSVVRVITAGTIFEEALLPDKSHNYLMAVAIATRVKKSDEKIMAVASTDVSTGYLGVELMPLSSLSAFIVKYAPAEILIPDNLMKEEIVASHLRDFFEKITPDSPFMFDKARAINIMKDLFRVEDIAGLGDFDDDSLMALGGLLSYLERTQLGQLPKLLPPKKINNSDFLMIDRSSFQSLEILKNTKGGTAGSLLPLLDQTATRGGARLLRQRLQQPLAHREKIQRRLSLLEFFVVAGEEARGNIKGLLQNLPDMVRSLARLSANKGGPRDLAAILAVLKQMKPLKDIVGGVIADKSILLPDPPDKQDILHLLQTAILPDDLPYLARDGGFIRQGFRPDLDSLKQSQAEKMRQLSLLEKKYQQLTHIDALKIKQNNIWGFYIEVASRYADRMAPHSIFQHRQTLSNAVRYNSAELVEVGGQIEKSEKQALLLEVQIFDELVAEVMAHHSDLLLIADWVAVVDLNQTMAYLSHQYHFTKPDILPKEDRLLQVVKGRHPVVEQSLQQQADHFTANDVILDKEHFFMLLTAPNMAGKSTFLRMTAMIVMMAQAGFYVPAESAQLSLVDRIFSRVGASDDLAKGQSTFMVEMLETANILQNATPYSLIIMDEIGRGTATFDGLSLAIAIVEFLHDKITARTLFATHYHELTDLAGRLPHMECFTMQVEEVDKKLLFLYQVMKGSANHSYGLQVAAMAGVPTSVVERAGEVLRQLEQQAQK